MRFRLLLVFLIPLIAFHVVPSTAVTNPNTVHSSFNKLLTETTNLLNQYEENLRLDISKADSDLNSTLSSLNASYEKTVSSLSTDLETSKTLINSEIPRYNAVNEVEFLTSNYTFTGWRFWFDCSKFAPGCGDDNQKYTFNIGDRVKTRPAEPTNLFPITYWEDLVARGVVRLLNQISFQSSAAILKQEILKWHKINTQLEDFQKTGKDSLLKQIDVAKSQHADSVESIQAKYETDTEDLKKQKFVAQLAVFASRMALKDQSNFDAAFHDAFKFEYNRTRLREIATQPWTGNWSYKDINSRLKVKKFAYRSEQIAAKYSRNSARKFNSELGSAFINETNFKESSKLLSLLYKRIVN